MLILLPFSDSLAAPEQHFGDIDARCKMSEGADIHAESQIGETDQSADRFQILRHIVANRAEQYRIRFLQQGKKIPAAGVAILFA